MFVDQRLVGQCPLCGSDAVTVDHVPPKVFLDDPMPEQAPTVGMCASCNQGASADEEYVASLIDVAITGGVGPSLNSRPRVQRALNHSARLRARLPQALSREGSDSVIWAERDRVERVIDKIGRALFAYETSDPCCPGSSQTSWQALPDLADVDRDAFFRPSEGQTFAEIGSRLFLRQANTLGQATASWHVLQAGRFAYLINLTVTSTEVRMVFSDYLIATVAFTS